MPVGGSGWNRDGEPSSELALSRRERAEIGGGGLLPLPGCRQQPATSECHRKRRPRQGQDYLDELPGRPRRRGSSTACQQREGGGQSENEGDERAPQEAAWYVHCRS